MASSTAPLRAPEAHRRLGQLKQLAVAAAVAAFGLVAALISVTGLGGSTVTADARTDPGTNVAPQQPSTGGDVGVPGGGFFQPSQPRLNDGGTDPFGGSGGFAPGGGSSGPRLHSGGS